MLGWEAYFTLGALALMLAALVRGVAKAEFVLAGTLGLLLVAGVVEPADGFAGFANPAVIAIGALFVVAAAVERTDALYALRHILRPGKIGTGAAVFRLMLPTALLSGFLNNTPIVAMLIPRVQAWARETGLPASKLLIPLSYAAIVGGWLSVIGTSTNLVVHGLLVGSGRPGLAFFDLAWVGVPVVVLGVVYYALVGHRALPEREGQKVLGGQAREYQFELRVSQGAALVGQTVEEAGLRTLGDAFLASIWRPRPGSGGAGGDGAAKGGVLEPATPTSLLEGGAVLTFTGDPRALEALLKRPGLERCVRPMEVNARKDLQLYEAVLADGGRLVGKTLREADFRGRFGGVVLAILRRGEAVEGPLGQVELRAGDLLLVEGPHWFADQFGGSHRDFYLVSALDLPIAEASKRAPLALAILAGFVLLVAFKVLPLAVAALAAALGVVVTGCISGERARQAIDGSVLIVIAAAFGIGKAVESSGLADFLAHGIAGSAGVLGPFGAVALVYLATNLLTEAVTNQAAAALMFPVAMTVAADLGLEPTALALTIAVGASASFLTPIGYQTNLMVMGPGGYRYTDYARAGLPLSLIALAVTLLVVRFVWM